MAPHSLRSNPLAGFTAAALILAAVGTFVVVSTFRFVDDSRWVAHTSRVMSQVERMDSMKQRTIAVQRGYLVSNSPDYRREFWEGKTRLPAQLRALQELVQDPHVKDLLRELAPRLDQRLDLAAATLDIYDRQGLEPALAYIKVNGSQPLDREIDSLIEAVRSREATLLAERNQASEHSASLLLIAASAGIPLSLMILAVVYRLLVGENRQRKSSERAATESANELRKLSTNLEVLSRYAASLQSCEGPGELMAITRKTFAILAPEAGGTVYLLRPSRDRAETAAQWGHHQAPSEDMPAPNSCWAVRRNQPYTCDDLQSDVACAHVAIADVSTSVATACLPLSAQGQLMGWLYLSARGPGPLPGVDVALQAAEQLSLALANIRLQEDLRHQSIRDPLTGLFNRRYLEESLTREISRCLRRKLPVVVLMFDLDNFKAFNDHHGHPGGDAVLSAFGRLLQAHCRPEDIPCRYGGEEFTMILPEASQEIGLQRATTILMAAAQMVVPHLGVPLQRITTSIGLAALPEHGTTSSSLLDAADKALYTAKREGRNRVCLAVSPDVAPR